MSVCLCMVVVKRLTIIASFEVFGQRRHVASSVEATISSVVSTTSRLNNITSNRRSQMLQLVHSVITMTNDLSLVFHSLT